MKLILLFLSVALFARENPFLPLHPDSSGLTHTTNKVKIIPPFEKEEIHLRNSARVLESIIVEYKNLDGSITKKKVNIHKSVDWHYPLVITQGSSENVCISKEVKKPKQYELLAKMNFIAFFAKEKKLKIVTKDKLLRDFMLIKPDRIVLDFKDELDFRTKSFQGKGIFQKITIGNHDGYYRVVIKLDGKYIYKIRKEKGYYIIILS